MSKSSRFNKFKKTELSDLVHDLDIERANLDRESSTDFLQRFFYAFVSLMRNVLSRIRLQRHQKLTFMVIPHNDRQIKNYQISNLSLNIILGFVVLVVTVSSILIIRHNSTIQEVDKLKVSQKDAQLQFARIREEIKTIGQSYQQVRNNLVKLLGYLGQKSEQQILLARGGELSEVLNKRREDDPGAEEIPEELFLLNRILSEAENSLAPLNEIDGFLKKREKVIRNPPTIWPVKGTILNPYGFVRDSGTLKPGVNEGLDIATYPGAQVLSAAPGLVTSVIRTTADGFQIQVRHNYGYETTYTGLERVIVSENEKVVKGEPIGFMGFTQERNNAVLHYEVRIGLDKVDPYSYLSQL